jgi:hypothetical protein
MQRIQAPAALQLVRLENFLASSKKGGSELVNFVLRGVE